MSDCRWLVHADWSRDLMTLTSHWWPVYDPMKPQSQSIACYWLILLKKLQGIKICFMMLSFILIFYNRYKYILSYSDVCLRYIQSFGDTFCTVWTSTGIIGSIKFMVSIVVFSWYWVFINFLECFDKCHRSPLHLIYWKNLFYCMHKGKWSDSVITEECTFSFHWSHFTCRILSNLIQFLVWINI